MNNNNMYVFNNLKLENMKLAKIMFGVLASFMLILASCGENEELTYPYSPNDASLGTTFVLANKVMNVAIDPKADETIAEVYVNVWGALPQQEVVIPFVVDSTDLPDDAYEVLGSGFTIPAGKNVGVVKIKFYSAKVEIAKGYYLAYSIGTPSTGSVYNLLASGNINATNPGLLGPFVGNYKAEAVSYGDPGNWDEEWSNIEITLNPDDPLHQVRIKGIAGSSEYLIATIDVNDNTITIEQGQNIGDVYGYGDVGVYLGDEDLRLYNAPLTGEVDPETGEIHVDYWGHLLVSGDYAGYVWDVFDVTFTRK